MLDIKLTQEAAKAFIESLEKPPKPSEELKKAMKNYIKVKKLLT